MTDIFTPASTEEWQQRAEEAYRKWSPTFRSVVSFKEFIECGVLACFGPGSPEYLKRTDGICYEEEIIGSMKGDDTWTYSRLPQ